MTRMAPAVVLRDVMVAPCGVLESKWGEEGILQRRGMAWGRVSDPKQGKEGNHTGGSLALESQSLSSEEGVCGEDDT